MDIQAKLRAGKGAGYARWASKFNLKQMAQTLNYLNDHGLLDYKVLAEKTVAATARRNELSEKIKAAEKRMAEIAVLRTHIVNYAKTRDTYAAYRKAGYSPKFRSEHEADILLHQAAKQAFDQLNVKKLAKDESLAGRVRRAAGGEKGGLRRAAQGPRRGAGAADRQGQCGPRFAGHRGAASRRKKSTASGELTVLFSVRRTRSQLRYRAVQGGLGVLPTTSRRARVLTQALLATIN